MIIIGEEFKFNFYIDYRPCITFDYNLTIMRILKTSECNTCNIIKFLDALVESEICVHRNLLKTCLYKVHKYGILSLEQIKYYREHIKTGRLFKNVKYRAIRERDVATLLMLLEEVFKCDNIYKNEMIWHLIYHIFEINPNINLNTYMQRLQRITIPEIFKYDISHISTLTEISLCPYIDYTVDLTTNIAKFIEKSNYILKLNFSGCWNCDKNTKRLSSETIQPILQALQKNTSVIEINLIDTFVKYVDLENLNKDIKIKI